MPLDLPWTARAPEAGFFKLSFKPANREVRKTSKLVVRHLEQKTREKHFFSSEEHLGFS